MDERSTPLAITVTEPFEGVHVVALAGELDLSTTPALTERLGALPRAAPAAVVVDLSGLTFIDSSGLNALVLAARARNADGAFAVAGATGHIARVLEVVHLAKSVDVAPSVEEALGRLRPRRERRGS